MRFSNKDAKERAKLLRRTVTESEERLWDRLRDRQLHGLKFRRQVPIGPYIADFFCHELRLVLELDGAVHEEATQAAHDRNRDANLRALGYRILRYTNHQLHTDLESILQAITHLYHHRSLSPLSRKGGREAGREGPGE